MKERTYYLDTGFFVAYYLKEKDNIKSVKKFLNFVDETPEIIIGTSAFTLTELVKVLLDKEMDEKEVRKIAEQLSRKGRLEEVKIEIVDVSNRELYDFDEFFYDIQENLLLYKPGLGDTIHTVIMKNLGIKDIITFNKGDFKDIKGIKAFTPDEAFNRDNPEPKKDRP